MVRFFIYEANLGGVKSVNKHLRADQQLKDDKATKAVVDLSNQLHSDVRKKIVSVLHTLTGTFFFVSANGSHSPCLFSSSSLCWLCSTKDAEDQCDTQVMSMDQLREAWKHQMKEGASLFALAHRQALLIKPGGSPTTALQLQSHTQLYVRRCLQATAYLDTLEERFLQWLEVRSCCCCSARFAESAGLL